jgi:hypothetical protein
LEKTAEEYLIAEFKALRKEIEIAIQHLHSLFRFTLLACGGIWTWLLSRLGELPSKHVVWIPVAIVLFFFLRSITVNIDMKKVGNYLARVERGMHLPPGLGWETSLRSGHWHGATDWWEYFFWTALAIANIALAALFYISGDCK